MASDDKDAEDPAGEAVAAKPAGKKRKLILIGAGAAILLLGGGGAAMMMRGKSEGAQAEGAHAESAPAKEAGEHGGEGAEAFIDVPPMMVNLRGPDGGTRFLKIHFMLVPGSAGDATLKDRMPMLQDALQPFLRELRPEDLAGSAAVFRVKEEILVRATATFGPDTVKDVLIQDLIQQ